MKLAEVTSKVLKVSKTSKRSLVQKKHTTNHSTYSRVHDMNELSYNERTGLPTVDFFDNLKCIVDGRVLTVPSEDGRTSFLQCVKDYLLHLSE